ncbi:MAG: DOMON-like domain-containing protein [bacterium]|nr:DOMON-like domain-containing protein [bacterium]
MTAQVFPLHPFAAADPPGGLRLEAAAFRVGDILRVEFRLEGVLPAIVPAISPGGGLRRDNLWNGTCFEAFVAISGAPRYIEVNVSPARDWNVYLFDGYRTGMRPDTTLSDLARTAAASGETLVTTFYLPLASLASGNLGLDVGLAAVIRHADGRLEHWALAHPGDKPDFHLREGFLQRL